MPLAPDPGPHPSTRPADADPLIGLHDWMGTTLGWQPGSGPGQLVVTIAPDATVLGARKIDALALYRRVEQQLVAAHDLEIAFSSSLDAGATARPDPAAPTVVVSYVTALAASLNDSGPLPAPVTFTLQIRESAVAVPPIPATVIVTLSRQAGRSAPGSSSRLERVASSVPADVAERVGSFAKRFRQAFPTLRLAVEGLQFDARTPWALDVRLVQPAIADGPTFFAPAPLTPRPQSGAASVPHFGDFSQGSGWPANTIAFHDADCDQLLAHCFRVVDELNAEPFASAAVRADPESARAIVGARSRWAKAYSEQQLTPVFDPPVAPESPTFLAARSAFSAALDGALADAYAIDAVVAVNATWSKLPGSSVERSLSLLGALRQRSRPILLESAVIQIAGAPEPTGILCYPFRPRNLAANVSAALPALEFVATHVGLAGAPEGTPPWLALIEPEAIPVGSETGTIVPVVNRFQPRPPTLFGQRAVATVPTNPTFSQLFQWDYSTDVMLQPVAQDVAHITIEHNIRPDSAPVTPLARSSSPHLEPSVPRRTREPRSRRSERERLASALFRFQSGFVSIASVLDDVVAGKPSAANIVRAIAHLVTAVELDPDTTGEHDDPPRPEESSALRLTVSLAADPTADGRWRVTIEGNGAALPETLTAIPLTADRAPQPNLTSVSTHPLVIAYEPQDPTATVLVRITLGQLDARVIENSWSKAHVVRNVALEPHSTTASRQILTTPRTRFSQPVTPCISGPAEGYDIAATGTPPPSGRLADWLQMFFGVVFANGPTRRVKIAVAYEYSLVAKSPAQGRELLPVRIPVLAIESTAVGADDTAKTPARLASELAESITAWIAAAAPSREHGHVVFDLTLACAEPENNPALLHAPNLRLALADIKDLG